MYIEPSNGARTTRWQRESKGSSLAVACTPSVLIVQFQREGSTTDHMLNLANERTMSSDSLNWSNGRTPCSRKFRDTYYSRKDGLGEARHVFLAGNGSPARFRPGFRIAELGFGTGLNMLAALDAWTFDGPDGQLRYVGFEAYPLQAEDIGRALSEFPDVSVSADALLSAWREGKREFEIGPLHARVVIGDARETLPEWQGFADAWFLDGFSPAKNPELWEPELLSCVARRTAPGGTFATYTAAGHVRGALAEAGFEVARCPGYGRKRHMTKGRLRPQETQPESI